MLSTLNSMYSIAAEWLNGNQGVLGLAIFLATIILGWASGIFSALRRRPKFKISLINGPTFSCTFFTGAESGEYKIHRTGIALYLHVANIGSSASSILNVSVAYHWDIRPFTLLWLRYGIGWFWLREQTAVIHDFQVKIGENIKFFPFLTQRSIISGKAANTFLEPGKAENGVVYFEQVDSWGGCYPLVQDQKVRIKVSLRDVFGKQHNAKFKIRAVSLEEARKYNPSFGKTFAELRNEVLPADRIDQEPKNT